MPYGKALGDLYALEEKQKQRKNTMNLLSSIINLGSSVHNMVNKNQKEMARVEKLGYTTGEASVWNLWNLGNYVGNPTYYKGGEKVDRLDALADTFYNWGGK